MFQYLRTNKKVLPFIVVLLCVFGVLLFLTLGRLNSKKDENIVETGKYAEIFKQNKTTLVYQYKDRITNKYTYDEALEVITKINRLFNINILIVKKDDVSKDEFSKIDKSLNYEEWNNTSELVIIKDGKIQKEYKIDYYTALTELENKLCYMITDSEIVSKAELTGMLNIISANDYLSKVQSKGDFYFLSGSDINKSISTIYVFNKYNIDFYYLDFSKLSNTDKQKLIDSNEKFFVIVDDDINLTYVFNASDIKVNTVVDSTYNIDSFIEEIDQLIVSKANTTDVQYMINNLIDLYDYLPTTTILNFSTYSDYALKAKMVLDKLDFIDELTNPDSNGNVSVAKSYFDTKAKELFGNDVVININNIGKIQSGCTCAFWTYNTPKQAFERGENGCGGDSGFYKKIVTSNLKETDTSYIIENKEAYINSFDGKIYYDSKHEKLTGTLDEDNTSADDEKHLSSLVDKLYTYRYTFIKTMNGYYLKSYEIIK